MIEGLGLKQLRGILHSSLARPSRYVDILRQYWIRQHEPTDTYAPPPSSAMIEPIAKCNLQCPECPVGRGELGRVGELSLESFKDIWQQLRGKIAHVLLFNQGEPLMVRHFDQITKVCAATATYSVTSTNATLLAKSDWSERLVHSGLSELILSIDGTTQETFEQYRVGGRLDIVAAGVRKLTEARKRNGGKGPILTLQMLLSRTNESQWRDAPQFARELGCDGMVFKTMQIERLEVAEAKQFLPTNREMWRYREDESGKLLLRRTWRGCRRLWWHPVIHADGSLVPCCFDKQSEFAYGNVLQDGFDAVWNGSRARDFRRMFIASKEPPLPMCQNCTEGVWRVELLPREVAKLTQS